MNEENGNQQQTFMWKERKKKIEKYIYQNQRKITCYKRRKIKYMDTLKR